MSVLLNSAIPSILLLGGGYVLGALADRLAPRSFVMTSRSSERVDEFRSRGWLAEVVDVGVPRTLEEVCTRYSSLELAIDSVPPQENAGEDSVQSTIKVFNHTGIRRVLFLSSTGVYGEVGGGVVDEESPVSPISETGQRRLRAEVAYGNSSLQSCSLRLSGIYGPGRELRRRLFREGYSVVPGRYTNRIHLLDILLTLECLLLRAEHSGASAASWPVILNVSDDEPAPMEEVHAHFATVFGIAAQPKIIEDARELSPRLSASMRVSNTKLRAFLGRELTVPNYRVAARLEYEAQ